MKKFLAGIFFLPMALLASSPLFAQAEEEVTRKTSSYWQTIIMFAVAIVFFYFILWRPEQKRRKQMETKRSSMKKGDRITAMGIVGTIDRIKEKTVIVTMVDGAKVEFLKGAISEVQPKDEVVVEEEKS